MSKTKNTLTGNPMNPWGANTFPKGPFHFKGVEIPVIDESSSREDLLRYIRILESRLNLTYDYIKRPDNVPQDLTDIGAVLDHDLPEENQDQPRLLNLVRFSCNQVERVSKLARGTDRVGCLEIGESHYKAVALKASRGS